MLEHHWMRVWRGPVLKCKGFTTPTMQWLANRSSEIRILYTGLVETV